MKEFLIKSAVFVFFIFCAQVLIARPAEIPNEIKLLDYFMQHGADIIYLGDSTINWAATNDSNTDGMPELLQIILPHSRVGKLTHASYQMDVYQAYAEYIKRKGYHPQYVIIPINLRSFSPEWDRQPLWQFEQEKLTLAMKDTLWMKFYKPMAVFKFFGPRITEFAYKHTDVYDGKERIGKVRDFDNTGYKKFSEEHLRNKLRFRYMYPLSREHRKIKAMVKTAEVLRSAGIDAIFYITPVDWQTIEKYLGPQGAARISDHVEVVRAALADKGVVFLDLSRTLPSSDFSWPGDGEEPHYPNEHLRLHGRMFVVKSLLERTALHENKDLKGQR